LPNIYFYSITKTLAEYTELQPHESGARNTQLQEFFELELAHWFDGSAASTMRQDKIRCTFRTEIHVKKQSNFLKYAGELNKSWINLGPTMWLHIIYEIGTHIHLEKD